MVKGLVKNRYFYLIIFVLIVLFFSSVILFFILKDNCRPVDLEARKLLNALRYYNTFSGNREVSCKSELHSPLYFLLPALVCVLFRSFSYKICTSLNILYYILIALFTYLLTLKISRNKLSAIMSVLIVSFSSYFFINFSRLFFMEFGLCAFVCMSVFLLIKTDYFKNRLYSILFGISAGLGMLLKYTFIIYITGPFLVYMVYTYQQLKFLDKKQKVRVGINLFYSFILSIALFLIFALLYLDFKGVIAYYKGSDSDINIKSVFGHLSLFLTYLQRIVWTDKLYPLRGVLVFPACVFVILFFYLFIRKTQKDKMYLLLAYFFAPLLILSVILSCGRDKYILPVLPAQATIIATSLTYIKRKLRTILVVIVIILITCAFIGRFLYLNSTTETNHPIEEVLLKINRDASLLSSGNKCSITADMHVESIITVVKYFIKLHGLHINYLDLRPYIRNGKIVKEQINDLTYLISDYYPVDTCVLIKNNIIKNQLYKYSDFFYNDRRNRPPRRYWNRVSVYRLEK